jgi:hypothetical protein
VFFFEFFSFQCSCIDDSDLTKIDLVFIEKIYTNRSWSRWSQEGVHDHRLESVESVELQIVSQIWPKEKLSTTWTIGNE